MSKTEIFLTSWCPYCRRAVELLRAKGHEFEIIDLEREPDRREEMNRRSGRTSVPQIFVGETHVGGYDDLAALEAAGELDALLEA